MEHKFEGSVAYSQRFVTYCPYVIFVRFEIRNIYQNQTTHHLIQELDENIQHFVY
jgi:hypothetical protein